MKDKNVVPEAGDQLITSSVEHHPVTAQVLMALFLAVGSSIFAGYSLGGLSNQALIEPAVNVAGTGFKLDLKCVGVNPLNTVNSSFTVNTSNTLANPVIVNIPGAGACDPIIKNIGGQGEFVILGGTWSGKDGKTYGREAIGQEFFPSDATHPYGYLKVYFKDPSVSGSATPTGYLNFTPIFRQFPKITTTQVSGVSTVNVPGLPGQPDVTLTAATNTTYIQYEKTPLVSFNYTSLIPGLDGAKVWERIVDETGTVVFERTSNSGTNSLSWTPATKAYGKVYSAILCPRLNNAPVLNAPCLTRSFVVTKF